jgi:hypothetical protein
VSSMKLKSIVIAVGYTLCNAIPALSSETAQGPDLPRFSQKGGTLYQGDHSMYLRTNDEWNGFSTFYLGYRYGIHERVNVAVEAAAAAIPHVYLGSLLFYFKVYETSDRFFFFGARTRTAYRYQDSDFSDEKWHKIVGDNYLVLKRNGILMALDITVALRLGPGRRHAVYYTIYPRVDVDFVDNTDRAQLLFSPITLGYEFASGKHDHFSVAVEAGYAFPLPWNSIPAGQWVNFPSLANLGFYFRH